MDKLLDQFAKLPIVVKLIMLAVIVVVIGVLDYQLVWLPKKDERDKLKKDSERLSVDYAEKKAVADNLPKFQEEFNSLKEQLKQAVAILPNEANIQNILRQLSITAKKTNIDMLSFRPTGGAKRGFYTEITMDLKLRGTYHDIAQYIDQVGKLSRIVNMSNIVFSGISPAGNTMMTEVDCRATTFVFAGGDL